MDAALLVARLLLALVFGLAGLAKLADRAGSTRALIEFGVPAPLATPFGALLPIAELLVAVALVPTATAWSAGVGAVVLLLAFVAGIGTNLARGRAPDCHCFGQLHSAPAGRSTLIRNALLAAVAGFFVWQGRDNPGPSAVAWLGALTTGERISLGAGLLLVALVVAEARLLLQVMQQNGRLLVRLEAVEARVGIHEEAPPLGLPIGAPAPTFQLPTLDGGDQALDELWTRNNTPALLLFTNPDCGPCKELLPEIARWQRELADKLTIGLISAGRPEVNRAKAAEDGLVNVLLQRENEVGEAYQAYGTPAGVLVRADGIIGSEVASGSEEIKALVARVTDPRADLELLPIVNGHVHENGHNGARSGPPHLGEPAPALALPDLEGKRVDLAEFRGSRTLVLFWSPSCGFCQQMLDDLKAWEASPPRGAPKLLVVSTGSEEANRAQGFQSPVLLDQEFAAAQAFGSGGTPSAVLVDARGKIASQLEVGAPRVLALAGARMRQAEVAAV